MDLTAITTPFGLLDDEAREALKAHGGPYEYYNEVGVWDRVSTPRWKCDRPYRVKPQPPKPREWWINVSERSNGVFVLHESREAADSGRRNGRGTIVDDRKIVHVVEVLE
jgi:hypothetical protein